MRFAPYLVCLGLASLAPFACSSTAGTTTAVVRPELVAVSPDDFMGGVRCVPPPPQKDDTGAEAGSGPTAELDAGVDDDPNAARSYVATLFDVTPAADGGVPDPGIPLASSPPTTCAHPVTFANVVAGRRYLAEVDAYPQKPEELTPISTGSRLLKNADGTRVVPRWLATCGGYPPSPDAGVAGGTGESARPPGVVSYETITQIPHDCGAGLRESAD